MRVTPYLFVAIRICLAHFRIPNKHNRRQNLGSVQFGGFSSMYGAQEGHKGRNSLWHLEITVLLVLLTSAQQNINLSFRHDRLSEEKANA